jgi:hypothetical protein
MKSGLWIGLGIVVVVALVLAGLGAGWALWGHRLWADGLSPYAVGMSRELNADSCGNWGYGVGRGMMGRGSMWPQQCRAWGDQGSEGQAPGPRSGLTIEEAQEAVEAYLVAEGYSDLEVTEVMEFERNFYAIAGEHDTGRGAMELLVDKETGAVGPEMGPNMMWNTRYGMQRGAGLTAGGEANAISPDEALTIARRWLDANRPGVSPEGHADPFYGYYTIHTLEEGDIEGMLSVHGTTGQVWYHTWHGPFVQMIEEGEGH